MLLLEINSFTGQPPYRSAEVTRSPSSPGLIHFSGSTAGYLETARPQFYTMEIAACSFLPFLLFYYFFEAYCLWGKMAPTSPHRMGKVYGNNLYVSFPLHPKPGKSFLSQAPPLRPRFSGRSVRSSRCLHGTLTGTSLLSCWQRTLKSRACHAQLSHPQVCAFNGALLLQAVGPNQVAPAPLD